MKLTLKGIGWLIFGLLIIASSVETYGWADKLSTIGIGLTFVLVYVMKQFFKPRWYGFFIAGGILASFCFYNGANKELIMPLTLAVVFLGIFYLKNKEPVDDMMDGIDSQENNELENFDYVAPETYEDPAEAEMPAPDSSGDPENAEDDGVIEIELKVPEPKKKKQK